MRSTMMDFPLTVGHIFAHGRTLYADSEVVTCEAGGARRRITFGALADRADQLAAALRRLGVQPGDRVATFGWNNSEHLEAYFAIPGMGAVMHTINIRLSAEQIRYIIGHAEDSVLIADASLAPVLGPVLADGGKTGSLRHLIVYGDGDRSALPGAPRLRGAAGRRAARVSVAGDRRARRRPRCATPAAPPACRRESCTATGPRSCTRWACAPARPSGSASTTACCRSCLCSTATPGACRTPPGWSAPTCCCRTGSPRPPRWPPSSRRSGPRWPRPCRRCGTTCSAWTRRASTCRRFA